MLQVFSSSFLDCNAKLLVFGEDRRSAFHPLVHIVTAAFVASLLLKGLSEKLAGCYNTASSVKGFVF